jgi:hypothetical protein
MKEMPGISLLGDSERCVFPDVLRLKTRRQTVTIGAPDTIKWPPCEVSIVPILDSVELLVKLLHVTVKAGLQFAFPSLRVRGFSGQTQSFVQSNTAQAIPPTLFLLTEINVNNTSRLQKPAS